MRAGLAASCQPGPCTSPLGVVLDPAAIGQPALLTPLHLYSSTSVRVGSQLARAAALTTFGLAECPLRALWHRWGLLDSFRSPGDRLQPPRSRPEASLTNSVMCSAPQTLQPHCRIHRPSSATHRPISGASAQPQRPNLLHYAAGARPPDRPAARPLLLRSLSTALCSNGRSGPRAGPSWPRSRSRRRWEQPVGVRWPCAVCRPGPASPSAAHWLLRRCEMNECTNALPPTARPAPSAAPPLLQTRNGYIQHAFDGDALTTRWIPMAMSCAAAAMLVPGLFSM